MRDRAEVEPREIERAVELCGRRVLDVGCGKGRLLGFLAGRAAFVFAFDPKREAVEEARRSPPAALRDRVRFAVLDVEQLDVEPDGYDVVVFGWSL